MKEMAGIWASRWYIPKILEPVLADDDDHDRSWERDELMTAAPLVIVVVALTIMNCPYSCQRCAFRGLGKTTWLLWVEKALKQTPDLHATHWDWVFGPDTRRVTAFTRMLVAMLHNVMHSRTDGWWERYFHGSIRDWLKTLKERGVDLTEYGHRELEILHSEEKNRDWYAPAMLPRNPDQEYRYYNAVFRLVGFQYGPDPDDWRVYLGEATDMFAGEFWEMVENPLPTIPGSWAVAC